MPTFLVLQPSGPHTRATPPLRHLLRRLRSLQEVVVAAGGVHRAAIGSNGSTSGGDGGDGTAAQGADIQEVLVGSE